MTCRDAIQEVFDRERRVLSTSDVISQIYSKYPDQPWQRNTISAYLIGLSVNHSSSHHYPSFRKHAFLFSLGNGRYRLWNAESDGTWIVTGNGVRLEDDSEDVLIAEEAAEEAATESDALSGIGLSLERDLEKTLLARLDQLEPGLRLYDHDGVGGQQIDTGIVGRLDLLAVDAEDRLIVIELKAGQADDKVCGQILRYLGWVKRVVADGREVRGIIIANGFSERILYAVEALPA
ncbi:MAG: endonuclease NucS domain-containing protein, partial [Trueperaceae bacterium]